MGRIPPCKHVNFGNMPSGEAGGSSLSTWTSESAARRKTSRARSADGRRAPSAIRCCRGLEIRPFRPIGEPSAPSLGNLPSAGDRVRFLHGAALQPVGALAARAVRGRCGECLEARSSVESENGKYKFRTVAKRPGQLNEHTKKEWRRGWDSNPR